MTSPPPSLLPWKKPATIGEAFNVAEPEHLRSAIWAAPSPRPLEWHRVRRFPIFRFLWKWTTSGIAMIPPSVAGRWDRAISARWNVLRDRHALAPSFRPRLETDWMHYMSADHVFDSSKLRGLGFRFREDNFLRSVPRLVDWYEANRFIPPRGV
ncbi:MAG: hypothetical protein M5R36_21830 [Deltaproteobacteria bacterium]|nr:hypothetical protein [Deltaproteobacteria bacterium]